MPADIFDCHIGWAVGGQELLLAPSAFIAKNAAKCPSIQDSHLPQIIFWPQNVNITTVEKP